MDLSDFRLPFDSLLSPGSSFLDSNEMISQQSACLLSEQRDLFGASPASHNMMLASKNDLFFNSLEAEWPSTLPTPPGSPDSSPTSNPEDEDDFGDQDIEHLICNPHELELLEGLDLNDLCPLVDDFMSVAQMPIFPNASPNQADEKSELRHDCMWSGKCDDSCKQRMRYCSENSDIHLLLTPASSPIRNCQGASADLLMLKTGSSTGVEDVVGAEFVDPSAVMSYTPHADHSYYQQSETEIAEGSESLPVTAPTTSTIASTVVWNTEQYVLSDTPSESEDSDSDEEESNGEDEEEIDVVSVQQTTTASSAVAAAAAAAAVVPPQQTVQIRAHQKSLNSHTASSQRSLLKSKNSLKTAAHRQKKQQKSSPSATPYLLTPVQSPQPATPSSLGPVEYPMPKVTSSGRIVQPTNRSASFLEAQPQHSSRGENHRRRKRPSDQSHSSSSHSTTRPSKITRTNNHSNSRVQPDIEDPEKRREHNSMERKRRDDLRFAFQKLRELVPEVKENPKAAKVIILAKAADFSRRLLVTNKQLEAQMRIELSTRRRLERKLSILLQREGIKLKDLINYVNSQQQSA